MKEFYYKQTTEILHILTQCFRTDKELLEKYHICAPADLETCVRRTYNDLKNTSSFRFFAINCATEDTDEIIGFFGSEWVDGMSFLTSFFIKKKYKTKEVLDYFWNIIEEEIGRDLFTALYAKNERAKKFVERNGFELIKEMEIGEKSNALIYRRN